jgi:hypothetical protein
MTEHHVDDTLLRQAVRFLVENGASIDITGDTDAPLFEMAGEAISPSQVILRAYAAGMGDAA